MWGSIIMLFAFLWVMQILLAARQLKHYQMTVTEMSNYDSGYLGVGVDKRKLGVGSVVIIVCDVSGEIIASKKMHGVTVFQRFTQNDVVVKRHIDELANLIEDQKYSLATKMAIRNIKTQMQAS